MRSCMNSSKISARDSFLMKCQKHKSRKSKGCKCGTIPISRLITTGSPAAYSVWQPHFYRSLFSEDLLTSGKKMLRQFRGSICILAEIFKIKNLKKRLDLSHDLLGDKHQWTVGAATFWTKLSTSLENCANIHVVGSSKRKLIGSISRRSEVPRSKQEVEVARITRNEIFLHGLHWLAIQGIITLLCAMTQCSQWVDLSMDEAKVIKAKPSKSDNCLKKGIKSGLWIETYGIYRKKVSAFWCVPYTSHFSSCSYLSHKVSSIRRRPLARRFRRV